MNSSGIKRGLAVSAVSAMAVAGLPLLASSASAQAGDIMQVGSVGPTLNGGDLGGVVVLKTKSISEAEAEGDPAVAVTPKLALVNTALTGSPNSPSQSVAIVGLPVFAAEGSAGDSNKTDGFDEVTVHVKATTPLAGDTAEYAIFLDDNDDDAVQAAEARTQVEQTTSGPLSKIDVSPASQSAAQNIDSGAYTVTLQDAAGRTTQLMSTEQITLTPPGTVTTNESGNAILATEIELGTDTFTAKDGTVGSYDIALASTTAPVVNATATLNVTKAASLIAGEVDIVTGADSWDGFGGGDFAATATAVRVDQSSIRIDIDGDAADANSTVTLNVAGTGITFGGAASTTVSTVLDSNGVGSLTITPDAGTVHDGDSIAITGSFAETLAFQRATVSDVVPTANPYFSAVGGSVDVTIGVVDQFGLPVTEGFVEAARDGVNAAADATPQRKAVGSDGTATFTFTDTKATNGQTENVDVDYFQDEFTPSATPDFPEADATVIKYTTDGMGSDYVASLDGTNTEAADYDASDVTVIPLSDTVADDDSGNESAALTIASGETGSDVTVSVDNGALILASGETDLSQGSSSITDTIAAGVLPAGYRIVGTESGVVTVTITSANRTETAQFTVAAQTDSTQARNVTVSGPAEVESGATQIQYTAVITDAFGNPVVGVGVWQLNIQVTGPAQFQDSDAVTNAAGQLNLNVRVDSDAVGDVSIRAQGLGSQFGAAEDRLSSASTTDDGEGLPVSSDIANATTTVKAAEVVPTSPNLELQGKNNGAKADKLKANADSEAAGATVNLFRLNKNGNWKKVDQGVLNANGNKSFTVADKNGKKRTTYKAVVKPTEDTLKDKDTKRVR